MNIEGHVVVLDRNACRNCQRPIALIKSIGWLHDELLPQFAHEELTCKQAVPVAPRCPECGLLVAAAVVTSKGLMLLSHSSGDFRCSGSGVTVMALS